MGVTDPTLAVATFNVRTRRAFDGTNSWPLRRGATAAVVRALDVDVIGLQEAYAGPVRFLARHALPGYRAVGDGRSGHGRGERCALFARSDRFALLDAATRWFGPGPPTGPQRWPGARFPRVATIARYGDRRAGGRELTVVDLHLDADHADLRAASVRQLASWLDPSAALVVLGDFNTDDHDALAPLRDLGLRPALGPEAPGTAHDWSTGAPAARLDHVFVSEAFMVIDARVVHDRPGGRFPSDHWPVRAELAWR